MRNYTTASPGAGRRWYSCWSGAAGGFGELQVDTYAFSVDEDDAGVEELLPGAVVCLVAVKSGKGKEELDGEGFGCGCTGFGRGVDGGAEADAVELLVSGEVGKDAPDEGRDLVVEGERGKFVAGGADGLGERGIE